MQPGDLVRVRYLAGGYVAAIHHGKIGVVVAVYSRDAGRLAYDVLMDGGIAHFSGVYLEPLNEAR